MKTLPATSSSPVDATLLNVAPSYMIVPFGEEYTIPEQDEEMDDNRSAASTPMDEEIQADQISQVTKPAMTVEEMEGDEDMGCNTPLIHDEFWEKAHPNSPINTRNPQIPLDTEILTGSHGKSSDKKSAPDKE